MDVPSKDEIIFCGRFVLFTVTWNLCEIQARQILQLLLGNGDPAIAVAAEIQNRSLCNALRASALDKRFDKLRTHLEHFTTGYERFLPYRNYYTHALVDYAGSAGDLLSLTAKGRLGVYEDKVTSIGLAAIQAQMQGLIGYAVAIRKDLGDKSSRLPVVLAKLTASLEKPQWPPALKKLPNYIQEL